LLKFFILEELIVTDVEEELDMIPKLVPEVVDEYIISE